MKIIICGAGRVGLSIASYLSMQDNDITVIDSNPNLIRRITDTYDLRGIVGHASEPSVLKQAGAKQADIIIAVTNSDETNMVACQVAHSVFSVSRKIARIRNKEYRDPAWSNLFSRNHMPIDIIISPEDEIADAIIHRMSVPGTTNDISLAQNKIHIFGLIATKCNDLPNQTIQNIYLANNDHDFRIIMVVRNGSYIEIKDSLNIEENDEIYIVCEKYILMSLLDNLGNDNDIYSGNIIICGGGVIGESICNKLKESDSLKKHNVILIEENVSRAQILSRSLPDTLILNGSALDDEILKEAGVDTASVMVSVMNSNENNILSSVIAKKMGVKYAISLSTNKIYNQLLPDQFIDAIVNPETITVSRILHNLRKGEILSVNSIRDTGVDIVQIEVTENCGIINVPLKDIHLPDNLSIITVHKASNGDVIYPNDKTVIEPNDIVILMGYKISSKEISNLFSFSINLF